MAFYEFITALKVKKNSDLKLFFDRKLTKKNGEI